MLYCEVCNKELIKKQKRFCSQRCRGLGTGFKVGEHRSSMTEFRTGHTPLNSGLRELATKTMVCQNPNCNKEFKWYSKRNSGGKYCSLACRYEHWQGENHPSFKTGYSKNVAGYMIKNWKDGKIYQHREVVEQVLGRKLRCGEVVHHINGNKSDNRNCNLLLCSDEYHRWLHNQMSMKYMKEHFGEQSG